MRNFYLIFMLVCMFGGMAVSANAADMTIEMLNKRDKEKMVYSEDIARIDVGDTLTWVPTFSCRSRWLETSKEE
mgnify:CR=1 FL=1